MQRLRRSDGAALEIAADHPIPGKRVATAAGLQRPGLLVSVRDLDEARLAAASNVSIIDLKEPQNGALGAASVEIWRAIANELPDCLLSAAMGELDQAIKVAGQVPTEFRFAKAGPVGARCRDELVSYWQTLRSRLPDSVELVAVAYADHEQSGTLPAETIFAAAQDAGLCTWLLDTFLKDGRSSIEQLGSDRLSVLLQVAAKSHARFALAGALTLTDARSCGASEVWPAWFAVRGDVCEQGRSGRLSADKISRWMSWLDSLQSMSLR